MKKILALVLALLVAMSMTAALAVDFPANGVIGAFTNDNPTSQERFVNLYKELTVYNQDEASIFAPVMTYSYKITGLNESKSVADDGTMHDSNHSVGVLTKDATGLTPTISGSVDNGTTYVANKIELTNSVSLNASAAGTANKFPLKIDFTSVTFPTAGVYRFKIEEETTTAAKNAAGIVDGGIAEVIYLDVYVKGNNDIYGYVCFKANNNIDGTVSSSVTAAEKTEGFTTGDTDGSETTEPDELADKYYTFNVTISKTLSGDDGMKTHQFPFNVDFTNSSVTANILLKQTPTGNITATLPAAAAVSNLDVDTTKLTIADGASVKYIGIPVGVTEATKVEVYELNDVTGTVYKSSYSVDNGTASTAKSLKWTDSDNKSDIATLDVTMNAADTTAHTIAFTNTLEVISPTGVVMRVAPYIAMMIAGLALLIVARKRRSSKNED